MIYNETKYNKNWNTYKLNELGTFARGKSKHRPRNDKKLFIGGGYPLIQTGDVKSANIYISKHSSEYNEFGLSQSKLWDKGTLCITIAANIAETALLEYSMCFPDSIVGFNSYKDKCSEIFMHYIFTYIKQAIQKSASGSIQDNINLEYLENLEFKIPSIDYQNKINDILFNIDKKININNLINEKIEYFLNNLFRYWFLQFEFPNENGQPYKSSGGKMVWNQLLKREIPIDWEVKKVSDILNVVTGKKDANFADTNGKYSFFTCSNDILKCNEYDFEGKSVLIAGNGDFNVKYFDGKFNAYQRTYVLIPKEEEYVGLIYQSAIRKIEAFKRGSNGSIVKFITKGDIENIEILIPKNKELLNIINKNLDMIQNLKKENEELKSLRDFLLPVLMNGQVTFKDL